MTSFFARMALGCVIGLATLSQAFAARIVSGPMLGWQEHREVLVWLETEGAEEAALLVSPAKAPGAAEDTPAARRVLPSVSFQNPVGTVVHHFVIGDLAVGASYTYELELDGAVQPPPAGAAPLRFSAKAQWEWRTDPPEVKFLCGSCNYHNDPPFDRPGTPYGQSEAIFTPMAASGAQFMVWLGDNLYLREADWTSRHGIYYRWSTGRGSPSLVPLLGAMHHYAVWDDHDYGPNDASRGYEMKETTLEAMNLYFPRRTSGEPGNPGIYTRFKQGDAEFFLLDGRTYRDNANIPPELLPGKGILGAQQMRWLKSALADSASDRNVSVRFIAVGSQFLSPFPLFENFFRYPAERDDLIAFIQQMKIPAVVFLTGDRHFAELNRLEAPAAPTILDFTSSSITAGPNRVAVTQGEKWAEYNNPLRVPGTVYSENNYGVVTITGPRKERVLTLALHNREGGVVWSHAFPVASLAGK